MLPDMQITAAPPARSVRSAPHYVGARALAVLIAMLGAACGADAGEGPAEDPTETTLPLAPAASNPGARARPNDAADATDPTKPAEPAGPPHAEDTSVVAPSIPLSPSPSEPSSPEPLPSAALDTSRPLLPPAPAEVVIPPGECRFEFLGEWVGCENSGWPNVVETDAPDLVTCMQRCLEAEGCTAVTDYLYLGQPELGCYLYLSTCDEPFLLPWGEEDAGRAFRRECSAAVPPAP